MERKYSYIDADVETECCVKCGEEFPSTDFVVCPCGKRICSDCGEKITERTACEMQE